MNKTEFFEKHGGALVSITDDSGEYGDFLILHPEEIPLAKELEANGCIIVSVHETEDGEDDVDLSQPCDYGTQPYKYGYFALSNSIEE